MEKPYAPPRLETHAVKDTRLSLDQGLGVHIDIPYIS
jgi:hypothetical protein